MAGIEGDLHNGDRYTPPPPYRQSDSLQIVVDPVTYAHYETQTPRENEQNFLFELDEGLTPFEPPREVLDFLEDYYKSGLAYEDLKTYTKIDMSPAIENIRERFGLNGDSQVIFSPGGSDTILYQLAGLFPRGDFELTVLGPAFQTLVNKVNQFAPENVKLISTDLGEGMRGTLREAILHAGEQRDENATKNRIFYMCNPSTPTGEVIPVIDIEQLAHECATNGITLVVDEVAGDFLPIENSIIKLTETLPNMIGIRSFSKGLHLPGLPGWAVMSSVEGERFKKVILPNATRENPQAMRLANFLSNPNINIPYLDEVGGQIREIKFKFRGYLSALGLEVLPTHDKVLFMAVRGNSSDFYEKVMRKGVKVVDGKTFGVTHTGIDSSIIRIATPRNEEDAKEVALLLAEANEQKAA